MKFSNKAEAVPVEPLDRALPTLPAAEPKKNRIKAFAKTAASRAGGSLFWHVVFGFIVNWSAILWGVGAVAAAVAAMIGWKVAAPEPEKDRFNSIIEKGRDHIPHPPIVPLIGGKTPEQIERERAQKLDELRAEADIIGLKYEPDWTLEKLKVYVDKAKKDAKEAKEREEEEKRVAEAKKKEEEHARKENERIAKQEADDAAERASLIERATAVGFGVNANLPLKEMRSQVKDAETDAAADADFQLVHRQWENAMKQYNEQLSYGKNAVCPECGWVFRTDRSSGEFICRSCGCTCFIRMALARFVPPPPPKEPQPPKRSFIRRMFGGSTAIPKQSAVPPNQPEEVGQKIEAIRSEIPGLEARLNQSVMKFREVNEPFRRGDAGVSEKDLVEPRNAMTRDYMRLSSHVEQYRKLGGKYPEAGKKDMTKAENQ